MQPIAERSGKAVSAKAAELRDPAFLVRALLDGLSGSPADVGAAQRSARTQAEELANAKAELEQHARVLLHDLREPLALVATYAELLAKRYGGVLDEEADELISGAAAMADDLRRTLDDLSASSRAARMRRFMPVAQPIESR